MRHHTRRTFLLSALALAAFMATGAQATPPRYRLTLLGGFGGDYAEATAINNKGHVTGFALTAADPPRSRTFIYKGRGTLKAVPLVPGYTESRGNDINDRSQVVGNIWSDQASSGFLYDGSTATDLGPLGGESTTADGINNAGQVVGTHSTTGAFLYSHGRMTTLFPDLGSSVRVRSTTPARSPARHLLAIPTPSGRSSTTTATERSLAPWAVTSASARRSTTQAR
jgi:probable HAF family extracellular repeat protein